MLYTHCRHKLKHRKRPVGKKIPIKNRVCIEQRPAEANGKRFGDWEMDLIIGKGKKDAMVTIAERSTGFSFIEKLPNGKNSEQVAKTVIRILFPYREYVKTITTDNGTEFAAHLEIAKKIEHNCLFYSSIFILGKGID